jgi:hypothetical protein
VLFDTEADVVRSLGDRLFTGPLFPVGSSLRGNPSSGQQEGQDIAKSLRARANSSHREDSDNFVPVPLGIGGGGGVRSSTDGIAYGNGKA